METTTLTLFWEGFTSTTINTLFGNSQFFGNIFIVALTVAIAGAFYLALTTAVKRISNGKGRNRY